MEKELKKEIKQEPGTAESTPPSVPSTVSRLYIGNLAYSTSWQRLKDHFKEAGNVVYADVFRDSDGRSKGCGIVEFETPEDAAEAVKKLHDSKLDGRPIFVREDRENHSGRKVFVGNLSYNCSWQDLKDEFQKCGTIARADILYGRDGRSKGQGSVLFETSEAAAKAVEMYKENPSYQGRDITVRLWKF